MAENSDDLARQLYYASADGQGSRVLDLLTRGAPTDGDWYTRVVNGQTPLMRACVNNHPHTAEHLLKWGAAVDARNEYNYTALHYACANNAADCVRLLLAHNSLTDVQNKYGQTAVNRAREEGHSGIVEIISAHKPQPREPLNLYPSTKQLSELQVQDWQTLGHHLGLTEDEVGSIDKLHNPTAAVLRVAKAKNVDLKWREFVDGLLKAGEYAVAERVCSEQGDGQTWSLTSLWKQFVEDWLKAGEYAVAERVCSQLDSKNPDACILNMACTKGHTQFAKYLIAKRKLNDTLLHAVKCGHFLEVEFLLSECHADPNETDKENTTLLALATDTMIVVQLLKHGAQADNVYKAHSKHIGKLSSERPPDNPLAIFITGDSGVGKSTFLKSMLSFKGFMARFAKDKPVSGVVEKTVGIIPYEIVTEKFGRVICYDFAGRQEFYASHCAVLENAVRTSPLIIVCLVDLTESEQKMTNSTAWWMTLVQNQCTLIEGRAHVIVVGSHADILKEKKEDPWSKEKIFSPIFEKFPKLEFIAFIPMDCRYPDSEQMKEAKKFIQESSAILRSPETVSLNAHTFYIYLLDGFKEVLAVSLGDVRERIRRDFDQVKSKRTKNLLSFIPSTLHRLVEICDQLSKKGLILYLRNEGTPERSFIICDRATLLSKVTGTVFAPESFRQHCALASSTGVVPLLKFSRAFDGYNIEMLIALMSHLELCFEITDKAVLESVREHEQNPKPNGRYLFFPGLIRIETPEQVWEEDPTLSCHFGWIIECSQDIEFFDPRCLQVLILRLVFTFGLAPARKVQQHIPSLQRSCSVWKNGIFWCNDDGIDSQVELSEDGKSFVLKMRSRVLNPEFLRVRSQIISQVRKTVRDFCLIITSVESVIGRQQVKQHPFIRSTQLNISDIASAVAHSKEHVIGEQRSLTLTQLLQFEPYASLDQHTLQCIHSEKKDDKIADAFISYFAKQVTDSNRIRMYTTILSQDHLPGAQASQSDSSKQELVHTLETWRDKTEGTYSCLRETLDKYSIFTGRNPLELAGLVPRVVDPSVFNKPPSEDPATDTDQLTRVEEATKEVCSDWNSLAVELEIGHKVRKAIERDYPTVEARFHAMLHHWARSVSPLNWSALIRALRSAIIGRGVVARRVETILSDEVPGDDATPPTPDIDPRGPLSVDKHLKMVRGVVWEVRASWRELGVELGIDVGTLEAIKHDCHYIAGSSLTDVLEHWLDRTTLQPKWTDITRALRSSAVGHGDIAEHIEAMLEDGKHEGTHQEGNEDVSVPVLPRNWTVVTDKETKKPVYRNSNNTDVTSSTPPGYPLRQTTTQPNITFYDEPKEETFTSSGGHADFNNGVEVTVPAQAVPQGSTVGVKVQPGFAPSDVTEMPEGIQSASPSYLISSDGSDGLKGEVTVTMEHHVKVSTREEANDLVFLQADSHPTQSGVYQYREVSDGRSEFTPGENKGRVRLKSLRKIFIKVGRKIKKWLKGSDSNRYTLRVYRSPPEITGDRLCVVVVSLFQRVFLEFLKKFEDGVLQEYPALSKNRADKTIIQPLSIANADVDLACTSSWRCVIDQKTISQKAVDLPVTGNFKPEELHSYPPRMVCQFFSGQGALSTTCTLAMKGFDRLVTVDMALLIAKPTVDTTELQVAAEILKNSASKVTISQLGESVEKIVAVATLLTSALRSSSLSDLAAHTDSIKTQIKTVLKVSKKVAEECTRKAISKSIEDKLSKMEVLSHQLCQVTKVKLKYSQDESEKIAALENLVEGGVNLLRAVDGLLKDIQTLGDIDIDSTEYLPLAKVKEAIKEVCADWYSLAVELGISYGDRKAIERDHPTVEARFHAMLRHWVRKASPFPSWSALIRALQSSVMDQGGIAEEIKKMPEVSGGSLSETVSSSPPTLPQGPLSVDKHMKTVREATWNVRAQWRRLGVQLGISVGMLNAIESDHQNRSEVCYTRLLEHWLVQSPPPSLTDLLTALRSPSIGHGDTASKVQALV